MAASLNTARALLTAKNYDGARRIVHEALEEDPDNLAVWELYIEIERQAGQLKKALELTHQVLAKQPDNASIRETEFHIYLQLNDRQKASTLLTRFKNDFPLRTHQHRSMSAVLDSHRSQTRSLRKYLDEMSVFVFDDAGRRGFGIAHHKIGNYFKAQKVLTEVHHAFHDDHELNATLATNSFMLGRPAAVRKYARLALAAAPNDRRMRYMIPISYLLYLPPFYFISVMMVTISSLMLLFGRYMGLALSFVFLFFTGFLDLFNIWIDTVRVMFGIDFKYLDAIMFYIFIVVFSIPTFDDIFGKLFSSSRSVKLKRY